MERTETYGSFSAERTIEAPISKVYSAFADKTQKERWFKGPESAQGAHEMDFRPSGREINVGTFHDGVTHRFEATYYDIVPNRRIIYAYEMYLNDVRISVSLATITFEDVEGKTKLVLHEDGVFLDNFDNPKVREEGTHQLLEVLAASL